MLRQLLAPVRCVGTCMVAVPDGHTLVCRIRCAVPDVQQSPGRRDVSPRICPVSDRVEAPPSRPPPLHLPCPPPRTCRARAAATPNRSRQVMRQAGCPCHSLVASACSCSPALCGMTTEPSLSAAAGIWSTCPADCRPSCCTLPATEHNSRHLQVAWAQHERGRLLQRLLHVRRSLQH